MSCGCLLLFVVVCSCLWLFVAVCGCLWLFVAVCGCLWLFVAILWLFVAVSVYLSLFAAVCGYWWLILWPQGLGCKAYIRSLADRADVRFILIEVHVPVFDSSDDMVSLIK
jgi:hypothetical protein